MGTPAHWGTKLILGVTSKDSGRAGGQVSRIFKKEPLGLCGDDI